MNGHLHPQTPNIVNRSTPAHQQHSTSNWWQSFVVAEYMSSGINNYCLNCRRLNQLHCPKLFTKCHKHYARFAMKRDSLLRNMITYLTCGVSRFHVLTLTFDLMTFSICSASAVMWPNHSPVFTKTEKSAVEFTKIILHVRLSSDLLRKLTARHNGQI